MPSRTPRTQGARPEALFRPPPERQPLAARMRPRRLDEFVGQAHLVGERGPIARSVARGHLASMVLWGPPGTGKTSLARLLAEAVRAEFRTLSAVMSGVAEVRATIAEAQEQLALTGRRTVLFLDEIHRFNKAQQDALLPHVEDGTITLIGATTENPSFEVIGPLLSRSKVFVLEALTEDDLVTILTRALADPDRGLGRRQITADDDALRAIARYANGDARIALNMLEMASAGAAAVHITRERLADLIERRSLLYDKGGEEHFNIISALHKSMRNSDPDASVYWLARMLEAGEDPLYVARRIVRFASEDIGNADPQALVIAVAAAQAVEHVGLPEAAHAMAQCAVYLALAPKSNAAYTALNRARDYVREHGNELPPTHLRHRTRGGGGYDYPHDRPGHVSPQELMPDEVAGVRFYEPTKTEQHLAERLERIRAARGRS